LRKSESIAGRPSVDLDRLAFLIDEDVDASVGRFLAAKHEVEFPFFTDGTVAVLVPESYGDEIQRQAAPPPARVAFTIDEALEEQPPGVRVLHNALTQYLSAAMTSTGQSITSKALVDASSTILYVRLVEPRIYLQQPEAIGVMQTTLQEAVRAAGFKAEGTWIERPDELADAQRMSAIFTEQFQKGAKRA
jgi:hypothetical protein